MILLEKIALASCVKDGFKKGYLKYLQFGEKEPFSRFFLPETDPTCVLQAVSLELVFQ